GHHRWHRFGITRMEWVAVILCFSMVISAELFNSAVERLTDLAHPDLHPLAGKVKDIAAGAVLVTAIAAAAVGLIIFLPYVF
ncbi:MAG: diacylglycerol kinase family protein, partial [Bacteroidaceae bacterium]|nr:diacylglycerol kinase family protein [Bacteroidaceae bacterium]